LVLKVDIDYSERIKECDLFIEHQDIEGFLSFLETSGKNNKKKEKTLSYFDKIEQYLSSDDKDDIK
jgi:hypothetical protein